MTSKPSGIKAFFKPVAKIPEKRPLPIDEPDDYTRVARSYTDLALPREESSFPLSSLHSSAVPSSTPGKSPNNSHPPVAISIRSPKLKPPSTDTNSTPASPLRLKDARRPVDDSAGLHKAERPNRQKADPDEGVDLAAQKVGRKAFVVVQDSDDDSDTLSSLDDLLGRREPETSSSPPDDLQVKGIPHGDGHRPYHGASPYVTRRSKNSHKLHNPPPPKYKFSLDHLVAGTVDDDELEAGVARAREEFDALGTASKEKGDGTSIRGRVENETIATVFEDDEESGSRATKLTEAINRTEALSRDPVWRFFDCNPRATTLMPFPHHIIDPTTWEGQLREVLPRHRAFLSGYVGEAWAQKDFSYEMISWLVNAVAYESRDDLRHACCVTLDSALGHRQPSPLGRELITALLQNLGARREALSLGVDVIPVEEGTEEHKPPDSKILLSCLDLFTLLANNLDSSVREMLVGLVCRMTLDARLMGHGSVSARVEKLLQNLLHFPDDNAARASLHRIGLNLFSTISDSHLQAMLLNHIMPYHYCAPFRVNLATAFLLKDASALENPLNDAVDLEQLSTHLTHTRFCIETHRAKRKVQNFDYAELRALTTVLDVAIDSGRSVSRFASHDAEKSFNAQVDVLADRIKTIFTAIEDRGASHMRRTEAKEGLEALYYRVVFSVRTRPPPKKAVFGGSESEWDGIERSEALMDKFLASRKEKQDDEKALKRQLGVASSPLEPEQTSQR